MLSKIICSVFIFFLCFLIVFDKEFSNKKEKNIVVLTGKTMGTYWQVKADNLKKNIRSSIQKCLDKDEKMLSSWKENSIVSKFNNRKKNEPQPINKNFYHIILEAMKIHKKTNKKLDITIGSLINIWGFGEKKNLIITPLQKQ